MDKYWEWREGEWKEIGKTFVDNGLTGSPRTVSMPFQKTLTGKLPFPINILVTRRERRVTQSKFFERGWENFCSQKFSQFPIPL